MPRPRSFDVHTVVTAATDAFRRLGYEATSVDDLVSATGLQRGSLYSAFGSKRGVFLAALQRVVDVDLPAALERPSWPQDLIADDRLDLLLVASLELAPRDDAVRDLVIAARARLCGAAPEEDPSRLLASLLGRRLLHRARIASTSDELQRSAP